MKLCVDPNVRIKLRAKQKYEILSVTRGINIQKYRNVFSEERIFSHVGCLSLSGFDEISKVGFETGTSLTEKVEQGRKRLQNVYAPMLGLLS